jgi:phosphoglycerol transferase MdoB-like AlkP superfamily enzyme
MELILFFQDIGSELGASGIVAGVVFFLIFAAVAYIAFRLLKKTVKMAFRMAIVAFIVLIALVGGIFFYWKGPSTSSSRPRSAPTRSR